MPDQASQQQKLDELKAKINETYLIDEAFCVSELLQLARWPAEIFTEAENQARKLVKNIRDKQQNQGSMEAFIHEYDLSSEEGVVLMCLAEALLRIPDDDTADRLIRDKISPAQWSQHLGHSQSLFVNASTWGLMMTGRLLKGQNSSSESLEIFSSLIARMGEPVIRTVLRQAMKIMGAQYVMGTSIDSALKRSQKEFHSNYCFSFDMLGEAALSSKDAQTYFEAYKQAIDALGNSLRDEETLLSASSISIKLSALHPRYEFLQKKRVLAELTPLVRELVEYAKDRHVAITLDAEEADRLDLSLTVFQVALENENIRGWNGFGLAIQAYQKRALPVLRWLQLLASQNNRIIPLRLVKGAYWDTEIKRAQEQGLDAYPVFTRKCNTDISYLACAKYLLENTQSFYPQFATHNAHTLASIYQLGKRLNYEFEFQRLHGMGDNLYDEMIDDIRCRIYAPVGSYEDLLPYLVRRLLENGANSSFVNRIEDETIPEAQIVANPMDKLDALDEVANCRIPLPKDLYAGYRENSHGEHLADSAVLNNVMNQVLGFKEKQWTASAMHLDKSIQNQPVVVVSPANKTHIIGDVHMADAKLVKECLLFASEAVNAWKHSLVESRLQYVSAFAELLYQHRHEFYALCMLEAGKTLSDSIAEVREAIDFCFYYQSQAQKLFSTDMQLPGPTGEDNRLEFHGRGVFLCISPWNFPLAIFSGQVIAALISGNTVIAKPSSNTVLVAAKAVELMHEAGFPESVIQLLPCHSSLISEHVLSNAKISGVAFTGSFETAVSINRNLAARNAAIVPLIAETGGLNVMIADSSALPEQVVKDVIVSAFHSAGQRCSALRVLIVQADVYSRTLQLFLDAIQELKIGDPLNSETDIPPVIDDAAKQKLERYKKRMADNGKLLFELELPQNNGHFVSPAVVKIESLSELQGEQFGPVLHVMSYRGDELPQLVSEINTLGYGLTLGIHSRINESIEYIAQHANVGNIYINRNMIGAVVGVQPFGGEGLSGTGPKAGGPNYLLRFCSEKTLTTNTAAVGGNAALLTLSDD